MKKNFSLIELIFVIAVISILVAIVFPNIKNIKNQANVSGIKSEITHIQKIADLYYLNKGKYPTLIEQPKLGLPKQIDFNTLYPIYIKTKPKYDMYYWIDYLGNVWCSKKDSPNELKYEDDKLTWNNPDNAKQFIVYELIDHKLTNNHNYDKFFYVDTVNISEYSETYNKNKIYAISSVDNDGFQSPPVIYGYIGIEKVTVEHPSSSTKPNPDTYEGIIRIYSYMDRVFALHTNGTIHAWGYNENDILGLKSNENIIMTPKLIPISNNIEKLMLSTFFPPLFLTSDNEIIGNSDYLVKQYKDMKIKNIIGLNPYIAVLEDNSFIRIEDGIIYDIFTNKSPIKYVRNSEYNDFILFEDGTVMGWGANYNGSLGLGDTVRRDAPTLIPNLSNVKDLYIGDDNCFAVLENGVIMSWGRNNYGQLGIGNKEDKYLPTEVNGLTNPKKIYVYIDKTYAIKEDDTVVAWGKNSNRELGIGTKGDQLIPKPVLNLSNVERLFGNGNSSFAVLKNGIVMVWGNNYNGQLGLENKNIISEAIENTNLKDAERILEIGLNSFIGLMSDETVKTWGKNDNNLGFDTSEPIIFKPTNIPELKNMKEVVVLGPYKSSYISIMSDGTLKAWGKNENGQLGVGDNVDRIVPVPVILQN